MPGCPILFVFCFFKIGHLVVDAFLVQVSGGLLMAAGPDLSVRLERRLLDDWLTRSTPRESNEASMLSDGLKREFQASPRFALENVMCAARHERNRASANGGQHFIWLVVLRTVSSASFSGGARGRCCTNAQVL